MKKKSYKTTEAQRKANKNWRMVNLKASRKASQNWHNTHSEAHRKASKKWNKLHPEKHLEFDRNWNKRHPERHSELSNIWLKKQNINYRSHVLRKHRYGLKKENFLKLIKIQKGKCIICTQFFSKHKIPFVDHCHRTKVVRGLLCSSCNTGLGAFKDSVKNLKKAIKYLERK